MTDTPNIQQAAVLGAGVMGAAIAAHLANAGIPCLLLDIKPEELTDAEREKGLSLEDRSVANRFAASGLARAKKSKPAAFYSKKEPALVSVGNFDDDLDKLSDCDWVVEAIVENLDIKKSLFERVAAVVKPTAVLSTNTSGISIAAIGEALPPELRKRFLVTHFFNPPRYLRLLELVPHPDCLPEVYQAMADFGERALGKGIVHAKDTANFIANRIGCYGLFHAVHLMLAEGYTIAEVDKMTGKAIGRPSSATFRTADVVGIDTLCHVAMNSYENCPDDPERDVLLPPDFMNRMVEKGALGQKSGGGFYKKSRDESGKRHILMLDPETLEYGEQPKVSIASLETAKQTEDLAERLAGIIYANDRAGEFLWKNISATLRYAANLIPEISDDILNINRAMRWGFGWEMGVFEVWDAIGVRKSCERMVEDGFEVPAVAQALLDAGLENFYEIGEGKREFFDGSAAMVELPTPEEIIILDFEKGRGKTVLENADASLVDIGDEVLCLEFHTKMNTLGPGIIDMIFKSCDLMEGDWRGMVVGSNAEYFSAGANLMMILSELDDDEFDEVEWMVQQFQNATQRLRYSSHPVVVAPRGLTLGGGCEVTMGGDRACAAAETYIGLVEVGAGVIPAGGGCMELVKRIHERVPEGTDADLFPFVRKVFETVGMGTVATSAREGQDHGFLRPDDRVVLNGDYLLHEAKRMVLGMDVAGYRQPKQRADIRVVGEPGLAAIRAGLYNMREGGYVTEFETVIGTHLARILCGGEVPAGTRVTEQYLLDMERQAFMSLCGEERTRERMAHILKTGRPLRN